jgi:hypothetical protein
MADVDKKVHEIAQTTWLPNVRTGKLLGDILYLLTGNERSSIMQSKAIDSGIEFLLA